MYSKTEMDKYKIVDYKENFYPGVLGHVKLTRIEDNKCVCIAPSREQALKWAMESKLW